MFLQQLGRGLRTAPGKERCTVVDFIGNHLSFLIKPRSLLEIGGQASVSAPGVVAAMATGDFGLPQGCAVAYDLEAVDLLKTLVSREQGSSLARFCRDYAAEHGRRPTAVQTWRAGCNPGAFKGLGWFGGLGDLGLLDEREQSALDRHGTLLTRIEKESITKSYKLVTLEAFLELRGLRDGVALDELAERSRYLIRANPRLADDIREHLDDTDGQWRRYWEKWPVAAWTGALRRSTDAALFELVADRLRLRERVTEDQRDVVESMLGEVWLRRVGDTLELTPFSRES